MIVDGQLWAAAFTPDGQHVVASRGEKDIVIVNLVREPRLQPVIETSHVELAAALSPDGHWLAYASDVSGRFEVYVRAYPGAGAPQPVSTDGGANPAWNPNGRELFYMAPGPASFDHIT